MSATQSFGLPGSGNYTSESSNSWLINGQPASDGTPLFRFFDQSTGASLATPVISIGSMNINTSLVAGGSGSISFDLKLNFQEDFQPSIGTLAGTMSFDLADDNLLCNVQN